MRHRQSRLLQGSQFGSGELAMRKREELRDFRGGPRVNIWTFFNGCGVFPDFSPPTYHVT